MVNKFEKKIWEERAQKEFWIDNVGIIHKFKGNDFRGIVSFHTEIAHQILPSETFPGDKLLKLGWVMYGGLSGKYQHFNYNPKQEQTIKKIKAQKICN